MGVLQFFHKAGKIITRKWTILGFNLMERPLLKFVGKKITIARGYTFINHKYISIGNNFAALQRCRIEAIDTYNSAHFDPEIIIGDNVVFNTDIHIGCINKVVIGNNVLLASRIYISDHSHGDINSGALLLPPSSRALVSKGPVIIEDNVWVGEGVCILPGVTIGKNSIIGSNAVVTKSFPKNSVIAGIPARCIKILD